MNNRVSIYNVYILILLSLFLCDLDVYGSSAALRNDEIKNAYIKGDYKSAVTLLEQDIARSKESASKEKRPNFFGLYSKQIILAYIHAWKLHDPDTALKKFREASEFRLSSTKADKLPPFELLYIAEIYESKNDLARAKEYYISLLNKMVALQEREHDDVSMMFTGDIINLIKYKIDGIYLKDPAIKDDLLLKRIKLSSGPPPQLATMSASLVAAVATYDFEAAQKEGMTSYIKQSPPNLTAMILNYALVLNSAASSVDEDDEKALNAFLSKYPDSYYSIFLRYYFYKYYKENGIPEKGKGLLKEIQNIADRRGMVIITGPEKRFSSPEKTWEIYKNALSEGDVDTVMECYVSGIYKERRIFNFLTKDQLKQMAEDMGNIERITGNEHRAEYRIMQKYKDKEVAFHINFANIDGEWRMYEF